MHFHSPKTQDRIFPLFAVLVFLLSMTFPDFTDLANAKESFSELAKVNLLELELEELGEITIDVLPKN